MGVKRVKKNKKVKKPATKKRKSRGPKTKVLDVHAELSNFINSNWNPNTDNPTHGDTFDHSQQHPFINFT